MRVKHNGEELLFFAKKVGSDYSLNNRRLFCVYKQGFAALAAGAHYVPQGKGAASAIPDDPKNPFLWAEKGSNLRPCSYQEHALPLSHRPPFANFDMSNYVCHQEHALPILIGQALLTTEPPIRKH